MPIDYLALKIELQTDPNAYGYAQYIASGQDSVLAGMLNLARAAIKLPRPNVPPSELLEAISVDDFIASANQTILHGSWLESLLQFQSIRVLKENGSDTRVMTNIMKILKNDTASETRVRTLAVRNGSRAEQLFGPGVSITHMDVAQALRG